MATQRSLDKRKLFTTDEMSFSGKYMKIGFCGRKIPHYSPWDKNDFNASSLSQNWTQLS